MKREYPRQAWVLTPSFNPKEVTIVKPAYEYSSSFTNWDSSDTGKDYNVSALFNTKEAAIAEGRERVRTMLADIAKRQETVDKRIAALDKAEGKASKVAAPSTADSAGTGAMGEGVE